jgi:hypothetical protein
MTATLPDVTSRKKPASSPELDAAKELVRLAKEQGLALTGPDGLLKALTKTVAGAIAVTVNGVDDDPVAQPMAWWACHTLRELLDKSVRRLGSADLHD